MGMEKNTVNGGQVMKKVVEIRSQYKNSSGAFPHEHGMAWMMDPYTWYALLNGSYNEAIDADSKRLYQMDVFRSAEVPKGMVFLVMSSAHPHLKKKGTNPFTGTAPTAGTFTVSSTGGNAVTFPHTVSAAQFNTTLNKVGPNQPMPAGKEGQFLIKDNKQYIFSGSQWLEMTTATAPKVDAVLHPVYPDSPVGPKGGSDYYYWVKKPQFPGAFFPHPYADAKKAMEFAEQNASSVVKLPAGEHPYKVAGEELTTLPNITPDDLYDAVVKTKGEYPSCHPGTEPHQASPDGFSYWVKKKDDTYYPAPYGELVHAVSFAESVTKVGGGVTVVKVLAGVSPYEHPHEKVWPAELEKAKMWEEWKVIYPADGAKTKYALESSDESALKYLNKVLGWNKGLKGEKVKAFKAKWFPEEHAKFKNGLDPDLEPVDWTPTIEQMEKLSTDGEIKSLSVDYYKKQDAKWWKEQFTAVAAQSETYSSDKGWGLLYQEMKAKTGIELGKKWELKYNSPTLDTSKWTVGDGSSKSFYDVYKTAEKIADDSANYIYDVGGGSMGVYQQGSPWNQINQVKWADNPGVAELIKDKSDEIKNALKDKGVLYTGYSQGGTIIPQTKLTQEEIAKAFDVPKAMLHTPPTAPKLDPKSLGFEPVQPQFTSTLAIDEPIGKKTTSKVVYWVQKPAGGFYKYPYTTAKAAWNLVNGDDISYHPLTKVVSCPKGQNPITTKTKVVKKPKVESTIKGAVAFGSEVIMDEALLLMDSVKEDLAQQEAQAQLKLWLKAESLGANTIVHHDNGHIEVTMKGSNTSYKGPPSAVFNAMKGGGYKFGGYKFGGFADWNKKKKYTVSDDNPSHDIVNKHLAKQATVKALMVDYEVITGKKVTTDMYADDLKCLTCGETWGKHSGVMCPKGKGSFIFCSCPVTEPSPNCLIHGKGAPAKPVAVEEDYGDDGYGLSDDDDDDYNLDDDYEEPEDPWN